MGAAENKQLIRDMFAELSKGNAQAFLGNMADNVRFTIIGTTKFSGTFNGKPELVNKVLTPLTSQLEGGLTITVDNLIAEAIARVEETAARGEQLSLAILERLSPHQESQS